ncbi:PAX3- and PAX7-binding protein 1 [Pectinophora gossypiella]|nr:PAX3- and PAX7-binding protein 1 [Pectinophora gossypiella]
MSMFRKPKKIQRRVFTADDDEEGDGEPQPPPPPVISKPKEKPAKTTSLLSFADEEEEGEVFQVKKSKQSSRLAKRREKERRKDDDPSKDDINMDVDNHVNEPPANTANHAKPKKKVTLEGLILSGREALAADGAGDVSDEASGEEEDNRGFHQYRAESVRAALAVGGHIPDAALIHAARKTRQQARELGGDYIPIKPSEAKPGSRLVRDDGSGDDDEDGRIEVRGLDLPSDKPKRGTAAAPTNEELDSEPDEWEEQQIKKAMPAIPDITAEGGIELNPFAVAPPPPRLQDAPAHLRPLTTPGRPPPATAQELVDALRTRLQELQAEQDLTARTRHELEARLQAAAGARLARSARRAALDTAYRRAQAARAYLTDLIECLDEKMPQLEALEARALALHRRRCEFLMERRRADVRDQAQDVFALAARAGAARAPEPEAKQRRAAEREGRRRARRLARHAAGALAHRDGDSSDDDLPPALLTQAQHETEAIRQASLALFSDALPAWRSAAGVAARLARWRAREPALYGDAYVADCLPRLLAPYVRQQLILWNPLADSDNEDYERMEWFRCLMMYGVRRAPLSSDSDSDGGEAEPPVTEEHTREDPDAMLVPTILAKVVMPKLTELVEQAWDPLSVRACTRLRQLLPRLAAAPGARAPLQRLAAALRMRVVAALQADVFLPALPPHVMEGPGGGFWRRCLGAGVRLLRATLALTAPPPLLRADPHVLQLIETLCCAAGAAPPQWMAAAAVALAETLPRSGALRAKALARVAALATLALSRLQPDNPLHLKALDQARTVIAEAKALE